MKSVTMFAAAFTCAFAAPAFAVTYGDMHGASLGIGANLNGAVPFPADNAWNQDISNAQVDPNSDNLIASIGLSTGLHPDFGSGYYQHSIIGIPSETARLCAMCISENNRRASVSNARPRINFENDGAAKDVKITKSDSTKINSINVKPPATSP